MAVASRLLEQVVTKATFFPGAGRWLTRGPEEHTLLTGLLDGSNPQSLTLGGRQTFDFGVRAMVGLDATTALLSDGRTVATMELSAGAMKPLRQWPLTEPEEFGWTTDVAASRDGKVLMAVSGRRLGRFGEVEKLVTATRAFRDSFSRVKVLPSAAAIVVGRGNGRVEVRDAKTLEVMETWRVVKQAILALCVLDENTVAIGDDLAVTGVLDLRTGAFTRLPLSMKTSGIHRLADGRLVVVGLSRRVSVFDGLKLVRDVDLKEELGDRYIQGSALDGDTLLLACEERGLFRLAVSELPESVSDGR